MKLNLLIDSSYVFYKNVYTLDKTNTLFGDLENALEYSFNNYLSKYPFEKIYIIADSKYSWRKNIYPEYKAKRKEKREKQEIDWEFCFNTYNKFKDKLKENPRIEFLEFDGLEADDIIYYIINETNKKGYSNLYVASDSDLKQLLNYSLNPKWINIQWKDEFRNPKLYLPQGYKLFLNELKKDNGDIFNLNNNDDFLKLLESFMEKTNIEEVDVEELLFIKLVHGDKKDNIDSVLKTPTKKGDKLMGIGEAGARKIYNKFKENNPEFINFSKDKWIELISSYIAENKKVDLIDHEDEIVENLKSNRMLIQLEKKNFPIHVLNELKKIKF